MLSDVSSLTELSSDDESFVPTKAKAKGRPKKVWQPKQVLKAPRLTQYSAKTLYEEILNGKVDLDPEYQRDVVWSDAKQSGLIDSILRNFYIPPIIFAFSQTEDGEERRTCIDGKQRLTSIQRFMDGQIPFKDSRTNLKMWYKLQPGNARGKELPKQYREAFARKQISCVEYSDITGDSEREIFQRVQLGVALTPAERMQAISGPWPQLIRDVLKVLDDYKISDSLEWSKTRGRDFHSVASIVYLMEKQGISYPSVTSLEKWLQRVTPPPKAFKDRVSDVFAIFRQLVLTKKFSGVFQKPTRVSPIEFVTVVVLINTHYRDHTLSQLTEGIRLMRNDVRSKHDDIRANTKVMKTLLSFINDKWPKNLKKDPAEKMALSECMDHPVPRPQEKGKRKRGRYSDSSDNEISEDERPLKSKSKSSASPPKASKAKPASQANASSSRAPAATLSRKSESSGKVKLESNIASEPRPAARPDRLAELRRAKERAGYSPAPRSQEPTPPPTSGSTRSASAALEALTISQDPTMKAMVSSIVNNSNPQSTQAQQMWPGQFNSQMAMAATQGPGHPFTPNYPQQLYQPNMPPASSNPNATPNSGGIGSTDPRSKPYQSGPPTPNLNGTSSNAWASANANQGGSSNYSYAHNANMPSMSQGRESRFDRPASSGSGGYYNNSGASSLRNESPRQPPVGPRGRGQGSPGMRGRPWQAGSSDRDREVLGSYAGGINGRDRDGDRNSSGSGWSNRNGR